MTVGVPRKVVVRVEQSATASIPKVAFVDPSAALAPVGTQAVDTGLAAGRTNRLQD